MKFKDNHAAFQNRWLFRDVDAQLGSLRKLPTGTLGRNYVEFLDSNGLSAEFFKAVATDDHEGYMIQRILQTHDLWHVVLGRTTSHDDEVFLQSFMFAQLRWPVAGFIIGGYVFRLLFSNPLHLSLALDAISEGWRAGHAMSPLFGVHWEEFWEEPVTEVRARLEFSARKELVNLEYGSTPSQIF